MSNPKSKGLRRRFTDQIMRRPIALCTFWFIIPLFFSIIGFVAYPVEIQTGGGAWYPRNSDAGRREDGLSRGEEETVFNPSSSDKSAIVTDRQESVGTSIILYFWTDDGSNMLDTAGFNKMREVEKYIFNRANFEQFCLRNDSGVCLEAEAMSLYVYGDDVTGCTGTYRNPNGNATNQAGPNVTELLLPILNSSAPELYCTGCGTDCAGQGEDALDDFVVTSFTINNMFSSATKSIIRFGLPLNGYTNAYDRRKEQLKKIDDFILEMYSDLMEDGFSNNGYTVRALNSALIGEYFNRVLYKDIVWVFLAIFLVGVFVLIQTGAPLLTAFGMVHIILSFPFSYFFLQLFFDIGALGFLNFLTIFIILGIGADDIFILLDAWKQSENVFSSLPVGHTTEERRIYLGERLYWTYKRASWAMLVTSLTTAAAFMMNVVSSVIPIQVFGIHTAFMVLTNYFMVVTYYPALIIIWEWYNIKSWCACFRKCRKSDDDDAEAGRTNSQAVTSPASFTKDGDDKEPAVFFAPVQRMQTDANDKAHGSAAVNNIEEYRRVERFLHDVWGPGLYKARWFTVGAAIVFLIICAVFAAQIEVSNEPTKWLPDSDAIQEVFNLESDRFEGARVVQVNVLSGLLEIDRTGTNQFNGDDIGNPQYMSGFDMSSPAAQTTYVSNCEAMENWTYIDRNSATNETGVLCPMLEFKNYVQDTLGESFPVPANLFIDRLVNFTAYIESTEGPGLDASLFNTLDDRESRRSTLMSLQQTIRFHKNFEEPTLAYMVTVLNTTIEAEGSAAQIEPKFDYFENQVKNLPTVDGYQSTVQTSWKYTWMRMEQGLVRDAAFAIFISLLLTLIIVMASTRDVRLSLMATLVIGMIVLTMVANITWLGWKISVIESICLTILVGLSVDYTIHLANAWQSNTFATDRLQRVRAALLEIGASVLAASVTTFLSAIPLLLTIIVFFFKFGCFIMLSVLWSTVFAFGVFLTLLVIAGPVSNRNDFYWLYLRIRGEDTEAAYFGQRNQSAPLVEEHDDTTTQDSSRPGIVISSI